MWSGHMHFLACAVKWLGIPSPYLGVFVGVDCALHTEGLGAQDLTVSLQGVQLEQVGR